MWTRLESIDQEILDYFAEILDGVKDGKMYMLSVDTRLDVNTYNAALYSVISRKGLLDRVAVRATDYNDIIIVGPKDMVPGMHSRLIASDEGQLEVPESGWAVLHEFDGVVKKGMGVKVYAYPPFLQLRLLDKGPDGLPAFTDGRDHVASIGSGAHGLQVDSLDAEDYAVLVENPTPQPVKCTWSWELYRRM